MKSYDPYIFAGATMFFLGLYLVLRFQMVIGFRKYPIEQIKIAERISLLFFFLNLFNFCRSFNWFIN
jgi:hypothetical protein